MNSSVDNPDAERAATKADAPGTGTTRMFSLTHNFTYIKIIYLLQWSHQSPILIQFISTEIKEHKSIIYIHYFGFILGHS